MGSPFSRRRFANTPTRISPRTFLIRHSDRFGDSMCGRISVGYRIIIEPVQWAIVWMFGDGRQQKVHSQCTNAQSRCSKRQRHPSPGIQHDNSEILHDNSEILSGPSHNNAPLAQHRTNSPKHDGSRLTASVKVSMPRKSGCALGGGAG